MTKKGFAWKNPGFSCYIYTVNNVIKTPWVTTGLHSDKPIVR